VTANPMPWVAEWCDVASDEVFHAVIDVWKDHWDWEANTVRPEPVATAMRRAHATYPNKRLIGHFVRPHQPFIGETGRQIEQVGMRARDRLAGEETDRENIWERVRSGGVSTDRVRGIHREPSARLAVCSRAVRGAVRIDGGDLRSQESLRGVRLAVSGPGVRPLTAWTRQRSSA
jgi:hypothetical protein